MRKSTSYRRDPAFERPQNFEQFQALSSVNFINTLLFCLEITNQRAPVPDTIHVGAKRALPPARAPKFRFVFLSATRPETHWPHFTTPMAKNRSVMFLP
jgi:hypothetical protein